MQAKLQTHASWRGCTCKRRRNQTTNPRWRAVKFKKTKERVSLAGLRKSNRKRQPKSDQTEERGNWGKEHLENRMQEHRKEAQHQLWFYWSRVSSVAVKLALTGRGRPGRACSATTCARVPPRTCASAPPTRIRAPWIEAAIDEARADRKSVV